VLLCFSCRAAAAAWRFVNRVAPLRCRPPLGPVVKGASFPYA
jgi:hypothetical protein